jgi:hypothetical protein
MPGAYRPNIWPWFRGIYTTFLKEIVDFDFDPLVYLKTVWKASSQKNSKFLR